MSNTEIWLCDKVESYSLGMIHEDAHVYVASGKGSHVKLIFFELKSFKISLFGGESELSEWKGREQGKEKEFVLQLILRRFTIDHLEKVFRAAKEEGRKTGRWELQQKFSKLLGLR